MNAKCKCHHVYKSGEPEEDAVYLQGVGCATAVDAIGCGVMCAGRRGVLSSVLGRRSRTVSCMELTLVVACTPRARRAFHIAHLGKQRRNAKNVSTNPKAKCLAKC